MLLSWRINVHSNLLRENRVGFVIMAVLGDSGPSCIRRNAGHCHDILVSLQKTKKVSH